MNINMTRWFQGSRWLVLLGVMAVTGSGIVFSQEATNRTGTPSPEPSPRSSSPQSSSPQEKSDSVSDSIRELREQVRELQAAVAAIRSDSQQACAETGELRR